MIEGCCFFAGTLGPVVCFEQWMSTTSCPGVCKACMLLQPVAVNATTVLQYVLLGGLIGDSLTSRYARAKFAVFELFYMLAGLCAAPANPRHTCLYGCKVICCVPGPVQFVLSLLAALVMLRQPFRFLALAHLSVLYLLILCWRMPKE